MIKNKNIRYIKSEQIYTRMCMKIFYKTKNIKRINKKIIIIIIDKRTNKDD